jgi:hypothetical protein
MRMMKWVSWAAFIFPVIALFASCLALAVPYASDPAQVEGDIGQLQWHGDASAPYVSVGTIPSGRAIVRDPGALRREAWREIDLPEYSVAAPASVISDGGLWVMFDCVSGESPKEVRTISLSPSPGLLIRHVDIEHEGNLPPTVSVSHDGTAAISACKPQDPPGPPTSYSCKVRVVRVLAVEASHALAEKDDLTRGDYYFTDAIGITSLGRLRSWTLARIAGRLADSWSGFRATSPVRLHGQPVVCDASGRFVLQVEDGINPDDTVVLRVGGRRALEIASEVSATNSLFRIMDFAMESGTVTLHVSGIGTNVAVVASDSISADAIWSDVAGVEVDYSPVVVDGVDCYTATFSHEPDGERFFRARMELGAESRALIRASFPLEAAQGVILTAPDGGRWRIKVANDGTLSTEAVQ